MKAADIGVHVVHSKKNFMMGLPIKCFEYMACSKPMVVSKQPYKEKIFKNCALFAEPENPEDIAKQILLLLENNKMMKNLGLNGRKEVEKKYSWENEANKLIKLYRAISRR